MVNKVQESIRYWAKFIVDNWKTLIAIAAVVPSAGVFHFSEVNEKESDIKMMQNQITEMAGMLHKPIVKPVKQTVIHQKIVKCGDCVKKQDLINHEINMHGR